MHEVIGTSVSPTAALSLGLKVDADALPAGVRAALQAGTLAPGIGKRLDGWPNRDLDVGAIIALSPALTASQKAVYNS